MYGRPEFDSWWRTVACCVEALLWPWHKGALNKCSLYILFISVDGLVGIIYSWQELALHEILQGVISDCNILKPLMKLI